MAPPESTLIQERNALATVRSPVALIQRRTRRLGQRCRQRRQIFSLAGLFVAAGKVSEVVHPPDGAPVGRLRETATAHGKELLRYEIDRHTEP